MNDNKPSTPARSSRRRRNGADRVTVKDVAERAGVAAITVSRVLNRPEAVSLALRTRVDEAVRTLGYVPNRLAAGLASATTRVIPVIVPSLSILTFIEVIHGLQETLSRAGYQVLLGTTDYDLMRERDLVEAVLGYSPSGVIIAGSRHLDETTSRLKTWGGPVVELMELRKNHIDMVVGLSNYKAGATMAQHLVDRGYRNIAFVGSRMNHDYRANQRLHGQKRLLKKLGLKSDIVLAYSEHPSYALGARALREVLSNWNDVDAIHFANDNLAAGAILEAQQLGIKVPSRVAISGFVGLTLGEFISPSLTTIAFPREKMGALAAGMLLDRLRGITLARDRVSLEYRLIVREST